MRVSAKKSVMVIKVLQMICAGHVLEAPELYNRDCCRNLSEKLHSIKKFYNHSVGMRSYHRKSNVKFSLQKHHFVYVYEVIIKCYLNFITWLYFSLALIR